MYPIFECNNSNNNNSKDIYSKWNWLLTSEKESNDLWPRPKKLPLALDQRLFTSKQKGRSDGWRWLLVHPRMLSLKELWPCPQITFPMFQFLTPASAQPQQAVYLLEPPREMFTPAAQPGFPKDWLGSRLMPSLSLLNLCSISKYFSHVYIIICKVIRKICECFARVFLLDISI